MTRAEGPTDRPTDRFVFVFSYIWIFFLINFFSSCMDSIYNQRLHIYFRRYKAGENCGSSLFRSKRNAVVMER